MSKIFVFDVDGTLTPSRGTINKDFKHWLQTKFGFKWAVVTGSDKEKTQEQLGIDLWSSIVSYNCSGNNIFINGLEIYKSDWKIPYACEQKLFEFLIGSAYPNKTGSHIEHRVGLCNFSVVGRNANLAERADYFEWDNYTRERKNIARKLNLEFPEIHASIAGETGIDIYKSGSGKEQLIHLFNDEIYFFGDRMDVDGNDYSLAQAIVHNNRGKVYPVSSWENTWEILIDLKRELT